MTTEENSRAMVGPYRVGFMSNQVIAWPYMVLFAALALWAFHTCAYGPAWVFLGFTSVGGIILVMSGHLDIDDNSITHQCALGKFRIFWSDIRQIEQGPGVLVLIGNSGRLVVPVGIWSGPEKHDAWRLLVRQIEKSGIVPMPSNTAGYKWHKNARVHD